MENKIFLKFKDKKRTLCKLSWRKQYFYKKKKKKKNYVKQAGEKETSVNDANGDKFEDPH